MRSGGITVRLRYSPNSRPSARTGVPTSVARTEQVDRALVETEIVDRADHLAVLDQVDPVAGQPGHEQRGRVDRADVPEAGQQQPALGAGHHVVDRSAVVAVAVQQQVVDVGRHGHLRTAPRRPGGSAGG